ncbi:MAG: CtsR family transcriptional regulator, partial [Clostridia bacterium]|nr:CtsR family transcriptional regulator [Clostridia bacterium]
MHIINSIGSLIDTMTTRIVIENCIELELLDRNSARLIAAAVSGSSLQCVPVEYRDTIRASVLKNMLLALI